MPKAKKKDPRRGKDRLFFEPGDGNLGVCGILRGFGLGTSVFEVGYRKKTYFIMKKV